MPPLTASWCWKGDLDEKFYNDNDMHAMETAFQHYLTNLIPSALVIAAVKLRDGIIVNYSINFSPELQLLLRNKLGVLMLLMYSRICVCFLALNYRHIKWTLFPFHLFQILRDKQLLHVFLL